MTKPRKAKAEATPKEMGRPTKRNDAVIERVLSGLRAGTPLTVICAPDDMPHDSTVRDWMDGDEELTRAIARAREAGFDQIALDAMAIADAAKRDTKKREDGSETADHEWISRSKLRVETRLKLLAKWDPKRYGEAMLHKHADADGEKLPIDEVTRAARLAAIASQINAQQQKGEDAPD